MLLTNASTDEYFLYQKVKIKKKYSNKELIFLQYFYEKTKIYPENVIITEHFIFFFVRGRDYFKARLFRDTFRKNLERKILIIRAEKVLIKLLFGFFPDPYIHDLKLVINKKSGLKTVMVYFLSFKDRGIAIGRKGEYIKAINEIFEKFVILEDVETPIKIKCENIYL
jgi:hypothetical protein